MTLTKYTPKAFAKICRKIETEFNLAEWNWDDIDLFDLVRLELSKDGGSVAIVEKKEGAIHKAFAQVAALAIAETVYGGADGRHSGGLDVWATVDGIRIEPRDRESRNNLLIRWNKVLQLDAAESDMGQVGEEDHLIMKKEYTDLADKLEVLAAQCRDIAAQAEKFSKADAKA